MTNLPPMQYLDKSARAFGYKHWADTHRYLVACQDTQARIIAHARALHRIAELEVKLPKETLEDVAEWECERAGYTPHYLSGCTFKEGFLRAAEMAEAGLLPKKDNPDE